MPCAKLLEYLQSNNVDFELKEHPNAYAAQDVAFKSGVPGRRFAKTVLVKLDGETLDQLEELLISADMGVKSSVAIVQNIERRLREEGGEANLESVLGVIRSDVKQILTEAKPKVHPPSWDDHLEGGGKKKKKGLFRRLFGGDD